MSGLVMGLTPELTALSPKNVFRYLGMDSEAAEPALVELVEGCLPAFLELVRCRGCCLETAVRLNGDHVDLEVFQTESHDLARNLRNCSGAILFAVTLGPEIDRIRHAAAVTSPAKALVLDAMGTAGIEQVCDLLCRRFADEHPGQKLRPRFSPGYGDLPLSVQKDLLFALDASRQAGIRLTESLLMVPQKSVSAIVGIGREGCAAGAGDCEVCEIKECGYRL